MRSFPFIEIAGPPLERGRQYGRQLSAQVEKSSQLYISKLSDLGIKWEDICDQARRFIPTIESYSSTYLEEMRGIAEGAGVDLEAVLLVNARTEIMYGRKKPATADDLNDGCTNVIALGQATRDGHVLLGQNWDWKEECLDTTVILRIRQKDHPDILTLVEAGGLGRHGLNSRGIGVGANFLHTQQDFGRSGIPLALIRRKILDSDLYNDALKAVFQPPRAFSNNIMIGIADGEAISLETTPEEVFWVWPQDGLMTHSNHFLCPIAKVKNKDLKVKDAPHTLYRYHRVDSILRPRLGDITVDDLKNALFDDFGSPFAVCRPPVFDPWQKTNSMTVAMIIMDLTDRNMWVCAEPHQNEEFTKYEFN